MLGQKKKKKAGNRTRLMVEIFIWQVGGDFKWFWTVGLPLKWKRMQDFLLREIPSVFCVQVPSLPYKSGALFGKSGRLSKILQVTSLASLGV
jgi:hypothetical protein